MAGYYSFLGGSIAAAAVVAWFCRNHPRRFLTGWAAVAVLLGLVGLAVPWQAADGSLTGRGAPIPSELIEHYANGGAADFPWPLAVLLNPLAIFAAGAGIWLIARIGHRGKRREKACDRAESSSP